MHKSRPTKPIAQTARSAQDDARDPKRERANAGASGCGCEPSFAGAPRRQRAASPLAAAESERKAAELLDIKTRVERDGIHRAREHEDRARQFMPFAALKGYDELVHQANRFETPAPEITDERAESLTATIRSLEAGDRIGVVVHFGGAREKIAGAYGGVDEARRKLLVVEPRPDNAKAALVGGHRREVDLDAVVAIEREADPI